MRIRVGRIERRDNQVVAILKRIAPLPPTGKGIERNPCSTRTRINYRSDRDSIMACGRAYSGAVESGLMIKATEWPLA